MNAYVLPSPLNNRGSCQCGWQGKRRIMHGTAVMDVFDHCQEYGHLPRTQSVG